MGITGWMWKDDMAMKMERMGSAWGRWEERRWKTARRTPAQQVERRVR
jgi:hypothetical protein